MQAGLACCDEPRGASCEKGLTRRVIIGDASMSSRDEPEGFVQNRRRKAPPGLLPLVLGFLGAIVGLTITLLVLAALLS